MILDRLNYLNKNISFYTGSVFEYDIKNAYPSLLRCTDYRFMDESLYEDINNDIEEVNKKDILIKIGREIKYNPDISIYLNNKLKEYLSKFQFDNNIEDEDIISIKKDALFVTTKCDKLEYDILNFRMKNRYSLFFYDYISNYEYYISYERGIIDFSIKGLGNDYDRNMYSQICKIIYLSIVNSDLSLVRNIQNMFMASNIKCIEYIPEEVKYRDFLVIKKSYLNIEDYKDIDFKSIYFKHYHNPLKVLINYLM